MVVQDFLFQLIINFVKMLLKPFIYRNKGNEKNQGKISRVQLNSLPLPEKSVWCVLYFGWVCMRVVMQVCFLIQVNTGLLLAQSRRASCSQQPSCSRLRGWSVSLQMCGTLSPRKRALVTMKIRPEGFLGLFFFRILCVTDWFHLCVFHCRSCLGKQ